MTIEDLTESEARRALDTLVKQMDRRLSVCPDGAVIFQCPITFNGHQKTVAFYVTIGYKDDGFGICECLRDFKTCNKTCKAVLEELMKHDEICVPGTKFSRVKIPSSIEELLIQIDIA